MNADTESRGAQAHPTMAALAATWALLVGVSLLMFANGLQSTLLGVRSEMEGYQTVVTGVIMAGYYVGFLGGSILTSHIIERVGHVRVFAALASSASIAVLAHGIRVDPFTWTLMRMLTGFSYAGLYVVAESWLNGRSDNLTRGRLLSIYMIIQFASISGGQMAVSLGDPGRIMLFIVASIAVSAGLIPILLSRNPAPEVDAGAERLNLIQLYRISPLGLATSAFAGLLFGGYGGMAAVYGTQAGFSLFGVALFSSLVMVGGALFQFPVGSLSDRFDRRNVIIACAALAFVLSVLGAMTDTDHTVFLMSVAFVFGGASLPLYSLALAYTNDYVPRTQVLSASTGLVTVYGVTSIFGPVCAAMLMQAAGPAGFFWFMAILMGALAAFGVLRVFARASKPADEQQPYVPALSRASPLSSGVIEEEYEDGGDGERKAEGREDEGA